MTIGEGSLAGHRGQVVLPLTGELDFVERL
jgi:hypothetical protein